MSVTEPIESSAAPLALSQVLFGALSILLFVASLSQTAFYVSTSRGAWPGWAGLAFGWLGSFAWLANPALLASWVCGLFKKLETLSSGIALIALFLMLSFLFQRTVMTNTNGGIDPVVGYGPGYWLWIASAAVQFLGGLIAALSQKSSVAR